MPHDVGNQAHVRVAIVSDLHIESDHAVRARCRLCGDTMIAAKPRQTASCRCGQGMIDAGDGHYAKASGDIEFLPVRERSWGEGARASGADLVVLAGDIHKGPAAVTWAAEEFAGLPVVLVPGNHEYYGGDIAEVLPAMRKASAATTNVRVLDRARAVYRFRGRRIRVLGATLWTDYAVNAARGISQADSMRDAAVGISDHRRIRLRGRPFLPEDALKLHRAARAWLDAALAKPFDGITVVVTHHAPVPMGLSRDRRMQVRDGAFASDLSELLWEHAPDLVVWGHTHASTDERRGRTRLVSHQRGYAWEADPEFEPAVIDLGA